MENQIRKMFSAVDNTDADAFVSFLTKDAAFKFANAPAVIGREDIHKMVSQLFSALKGLQHEIKNVWQCGDVVICEGSVTYTRLDDRKLSYPFANIMRVKSDLISDYRIYVDSSTLFV